MGGLAGLRFSPPELELPIELRWLLAAAFGPRLPPPPSGADTAELTRLCRKFDLAPRIVARQGADRLAEGLGRAAGELVRLHRRGVAQDLAGERAARRLAALATAYGLPLIFLKGYAMKLVAPGPAGWRPAADLDVLARADDATRLRDALLESNWRSQVGAGNPHHLAPLIAPEGTPVDIHFRLRGVSLRQQEWTTAEELLAEDLCRPVPGFSEQILIPQTRILAAHLVAHAIEQHGHRPATYPQLRAVADLADLHAATGESLDSEILPLIRATVSQEELEALSRLAHLLTAGQLPDASRQEDEAAESLLRHVVAGSLDSGYRRALQLDHSAARARHARQEGRLLRYLFAKLYLTDDEIETRQGQPPTRWGYLRRRIGRPFSLAARIIRAAVSRLRQSLGR